MADASALTKGGVYLPEHLSGAVGLAGAPVHDLGRDAQPTGSTTMYTAATGLTAATMTCAMPGAAVHHGTTSYSTENDSSHPCGPPHYI
jgi:hypothetical protein